jgi:signal transduction histidine kinase
MDMSAHSSAVRREQIVGVYRPIAVMSVATYLGGLALAILMSEEIPVVVLAWWLVALYVMQTVCLALYFVFQRSRVGRVDLSPWGRRIVWMTFVNGFVWGSAGVVMYQSNFSYAQAMLVVALFLVMVSGATGLVAYFPAIPAFHVPIIAPIIVRMLLEGDRFHLIIAASCAMMLMLLLFYGWDVSRIIAESLEMRFENEALSEALTEQKVRERTQVLEAANRHKSEFLANMSHELRTPLNAIIGFSEVLQERMFGELNPKQARHIQNIHASGQHLLALINDILDLSKIEAGHMELHVSSFRVAEALSSALMLVKERAQRNGTSLVASFDDTLGSFEGDERKFKQIVTNLLSNAVKFTSQGGTVELRAERTQTDLVVAVKDTGIGIAEEDLETIFEQFRQVGADYSKKGEGTGLGLTLSKKFVELHGGKIEVRSQVNVGSTFTFRLPVSLRTAAVAGSESPS